LLLEIERLRLALKKEGQRADKESSRANRESLRADAYNEIIKIAESKFNIKIRKKAGVKQ
ncbi:MAG: transposase, partial [Bacteroidales bacterium]